MGRPTKCTPEAIELMGQAIRGGLPIRQACSLAGISADAHYAWLERAEKGEKPFVGYLEAVKKAEAEFVNECLQSIAAASFNGQWTAAAWLLERKFPDEFGRRERSQVTLSGPDGGPVQVQQDATLTMLVDPEARALAVALTERLASGPVAPDEADGG